MTPEQMVQVMDKMNQIHGVAWAILIVQVLIGVALFVAHGRIARNQVATADLLKQAVAKIESDLPAKK